jgi:predicted Ser/Thr protein kinase
VTTETQPTAVTGEEEEPTTEFEAVLAGLGHARKVGRYTLLELLGSGGMGVVFTAYDEELDRKVAIKFLQRSGAAQAGALLREAQAQARLAHPNVIHVYEVGVADGRVFLAMEFVRGLGLREWSRAGRSRAEVVEVFVQAGRGLAAAHAAGLVHCDFKPENVLVGQDGRVRVLDFGLARHSGARVEDAPGGGTPGYMAPEQFEGREVDARSDQFSFCVALFEALYGQRPFVGGSLPALMLAVTGGEVAAAAGEARVPARLRRAVRRGLARVPAERHAGMTALLTELELVQPRPRGRWAIAAAVSAALTTSAWWAASGGEDAAAACAATAAAEVAAVWGEAPRAAIGRVFAATELAYAADSFERTARLLDAYVDAWAQVRQTDVRAGGWGCRTGFTALHAGASGGALPRAAARGSGGLGGHAAARRRGAGRGGGGGDERAAGAGGVRGSVGVAGGG